MAVATAVFTGLAFTADTKEVKATAPLILGELPYQKVVTKDLAKGASLGVNVANGNVLLKTQDLNIASVGVGLSVTRYFNNLGTAAGQTGDRGLLAIGPDVSITANANGSATFQGPSGFQVTFPSNGAGGYTTPAEYTSADLEVNPAGGWTLTKHNPYEFYNFNATGKLETHQDASGIGLTYTYNTNGTLAKVEDDQGKETFFSNYSGNKVGTITDVLGRTVNYSYDSSGKLTHVVDVRGNDWWFEYNDGRGNLTEVTDPTSNVTTLAYDMSNRVTSIKYDDFTSAVAEWQYAYNSTNTVVTDALNHATTYSYDTAGRVVDVIDAVGSHRGSTWDASNNVTQTTDPSSQITKTTFDSLNNAISRQNPNTSGGSPGAMSSSEYNDTVHPYLASKDTDAAGNTVSYSYNANGQTKSAVNAAFGTITYWRQDDPHPTTGTVNCGAYTGQVCSSVDGRGNTTSYTYDASGNLLQITPPGPVGPTKYTYDAASRPITITDGNNSKRTIAYNKADQPTSVTYATGGAVVSFTYDSNGNVKTRVDNTGTATYSYDGFNRITKLQQTSKPAINYTYDAVGNLKTEQTTAGTTTYSYDGANQLTNINQAITGANIGFTYTNGRVTSVTKPGGITETITYDNAGRQTSIKAMKGATVLTNYTASYAKASGQDTALMQTETNNVTGLTTTYTYDAANRLATAMTPGGDGYNYSYDATGNRIKVVKNSVVSPVYNFNAANQPSNYTTATFDAAGNQTMTNSNLALGYNPKNQTTSFTPSGASAIMATYNDVGQVGRTQFGTKAQLNSLLGLYSDTTGSTSTYYTHMPGGSNQTVGQIIGTTAYYYLTDLRGSVVKMTNASGTVVNTYSYDPYGTQTATTGTIANPIRYAGGYYDTQTSLYKFGARYYSSQDARWTQLDPSGAEKGYLYAGDNPVNFVDPSGYLKISDLTAGIGAYYGVGIAVSFCAATAGASCVLALGITGGIIGGGLGSAVGGGTASDIRDDAALGGLGGALPYLKPYIKSVF